VGLFYKVQSATLSSQTLDIVGVERIQTYQVLAPGLKSKGHLRPESEVGGM